MAKAKLTIEQELLAVTKIKPKAKEDIQTYLVRLVEAVQDLKDPQWEALSEDAQQWVNDGATAIKKDRDIEPFPDEEPAVEEEEEADAEVEDEDEKPASKKRGRARADDDEDEKPAKKRSRATDDDDDEKPARKRGRAADDDDDEPAPRKKRAADDDDDDEKPARNRSRGDDNEEDEDVAKKKKTAAKKAPAKPAKKDGKPKAPGAQLLIKRAVIKNPDATTEKIIAQLEAKGVDATASAVSTIRSGTLQTMRLIKELGLPKGDF